MHIPDLSSKDISKGLTIAIIDDGFNLDHQTLKDHIFRNPQEASSGNDDDGNGFIDDLVGWDVADNDNDVSIIEGREEYFYHGTMVAGVVIRVLEDCFGKEASRSVRILPVKVLSDNAQKHDYSHGYNGIDYAITMNADVIICAWSGGSYDADKYAEIFARAKKKDILILASAGNFYSSHCDPPASVSSVYAIAAIDSTGRKYDASNYGEKVVLSAAGEFVYAPHPAATNTYGYLDGTSSAVALVGGCAAVLKAVSPDAGGIEIMSALMNTAVPLDKKNSTYAGRLGSGSPNLTKAISYISEQKNRDAYFDSRKSKGSIFINKYSEAETWRISPFGSYNTYVFSLIGNWPATKSPIEFYTGDSLQESYTPSEFPPKVVIQADSVQVRYVGKRGKKPGQINYVAMPVDSTKMYCSGLTHLNEMIGEVEDGSGSDNYANRVDCKWLITVPNDKRIRLEFDEFGTQPKTDFVWIFEGKGALQENILAKFSGPDIPPIIISGSNQVLVWFVTDRTRTAEGWHLKYTATDEMPGVFAQ